MRRIVYVVVAVLALGGGIALAAVTTDDGAPGTQTATTTNDLTTTFDDATTSVEDATTTVEGTTTSDAVTTTETGEDVSGPCDEAEHEDDPRCTGGDGHGRSDNSGPGSDDSGHGGDDD